MADYGASIITKRTWQARLPNPTNIAEWGKAHHHASDEFDRWRGRPVKYDDDLVIRADDDGIYIEFDLDDTAEPALCGSRGPRIGEDVPVCRLPRGHFASHENTEEDGFGQVIRW